jgi:Helicase conserved C-terminal domain
MIKEKRDSLERFIREQINGPGISGYRFVDIEDESIVSRQIKSMLSIDNYNELLDIVPAAVYSTGILFPDEIKRQDGNHSSMGGLSNNESVPSEDVAGENGSQESTLPDVEETNGIQIDQMYPKSMGFTCCLNNTIVEEKQIEIKLQARYYTKIQKDKEGKYNDKYGLFCEVEREKISHFIQLYELNDFVIRVIGENTFVLLKKIPSEKISQLRARIREIQKHLAEDLFDQASLVITFIKLIKANCYLSNLKSTIYYELKNTVVDKTRRDKLYFITQDIELIENISDHLNNLLDINSGGYGLWRSELIERIINISDFHFPKDIRKTSILFSDKNSNETIKVLKSDHTVIGNNLKNVFINPLNNSDDYASLSLNIQFSRDSRKNNGKIFLKVQIVNTSKPFDENEKDDNRYFSTFNELVNQKCFFGVKLSFTNSHLIPYNDFEINENPDGYNEDTATKFIYRQYEDFGIGHGCSVKWDKKTKTIETEYIPICDTPDVDPTPRNKDKREKAEFESGEYKDPPFISTTKYQEFKWLSIFSDASNEEILQGLNAFINSYSQWIEIKKLDISKEKDSIKSLAQKEIDKCSGDYIRMKGNIEKFLSGTTNIDNLMSFRLMNAAMFMQLWHSVKVKNSEVNGIISDDNFQVFDLKFYKEKANDRLPSDNSEPACWRAFQLAFIILNLDGIFRDKKDITWEKRNEWVDLIWFPTGGGKTEAYLGLIALTIINRRKLHGIQGGGTAALIRYTLRLLTLQQFQRATLVIMALELMRRWDLYNLGDEPIYIGLWVGKNSIPNSIADLILEHQKIKNEQENKIPLSYCPWCKSKLRPSLNKDNSDNVFYNSRLHLYCDNNRCSFTEDFFNADTLKGPIPVSLCDDTIYLHPPALLFGTVDKFAQLAHKINGTDKGRDCDSRRIFGRGNWEIGKPKAGYLPPDLIIQDELHLLLGPLGSAVALFESAVDQLCTRNDGTRPKVISSTATTRNTNLQIAALFDRKVDLFPKPGIDCDDSFFAFYKRNYSDENKSSFQYLSKRRYLGILPTGRTQIWMQMRLAAILMTHRAVFELQELKDNDTIDFEAYEKFEKAMDYYHTTISYFNSLKEVGKTQSQVQSYILKELRRVFARVVRPQKLIHSLYTYGPIREAELTGRLSGEEVKNELKKVEDKFIARKRFAYVEDKEIIKGNTPPEFVVATNMISVGIDVSRFNLIIMNSMPRNIAEYIQASSRIARDSYGLVLTIHHPFRARDMSHYEKFIEFHEKMYSYVEPISITPFTHKAVERYLGLYLATIIRHLTKFVERNSAADISTMSINQMTNIIDELTKYFIKRKIHFQKFDILIQNLIKEENVENIRRWITEALKEWKEECNKTLSDNKKFVFNNKSNKAVPPQEQLYVDIEEYEGNIHSKKWQVPMSLRVIEPEAAIRIISK